MSELPPTLVAALRAGGQEHLVGDWARLEDAGKSAYLAQLQELDLDQLARLRSGDASAAGEPIAQKASRAIPPRKLVQVPRSEQDEAAWQAAAARGDQALRDGKVGAILVAGGQGTRLRFDHPKGMFSIAPVSQASLFQLLCEQLLARGRRAGVRIPYYIMTSDATHDETVAYFDKHHHFGLDPQDVHFFRQGTMPAVCQQTGRILRTAPGQIATSPDGHGGLLPALARAGLLEDMARRGIEYLYYHQVDNPLAVVCDPAFLGWHLHHDAEVSTKVVRKTGPAEKMGVMVDVDGVTQIIEYSDLPAEAAERLTPDGELELWAGSTAIHVFHRRFLERIVAEGLNLPFHHALKKVPHVDDAGAVVDPAEPNAIKFERFIFDVLPLTDRALVVETLRETEFNPVKNAVGVNSPADVQQSLCKLHAGWLRAAGIPVPPLARVEISPLYALDAAEFAAKVDRAMTLTPTMYFGP